MECDNIEERIYKRVPVRSWHIRNSRKQAMKFLALVLCAAAFSSALAGPIEHVAHVVEVTTMKATGVPPMVDACEMECTKLEFDPICSSNGRCVHEFPNKCVMDVFSCRHPHLAFLAVDPMRCRKPTMPRCSDQDLKGVGE